MHGEKETALYSRRGNSMNERFAEVWKAVRQLPPGLVLDGEVVALDQKGRPVFNLLQNHHSKPQPLFYYLFDVLAFAGRDLRGEPLEHRRRVLERELGPKLKDPIRVSQRLDAEPEALIRSATELGLEGLVAKRADSLYEAGERSGVWVKYKTVQSKEMVVGGYKPGAQGFEDLLVGYYEKGKLLFSAKLRNGFVPALRKEIAARFPALETKECPFANLPEKASARRGEALTAEAMKKQRWLKPELVVSVGYTDWTAANHLRHSKFLGIRDDKAAKEVVREVAE